MLQEAMRIWAEFEGGGVANVAVVGSAWRGAKEHPGITKPRLGRV
jgi:hypothetical protein